MSVKVAFGLLERGAVSGKAPPADRCSVALFGLLEQGLLTGSTRFAYMLL